MKTKENVKKIWKSNEKNIFYKSNPEGISLIVLVITIIVIIILATAIIVTLLGNNPIAEANKARFESDRDNMQSIFTNTVAKVMAQKNCTMQIRASSLNTVTSGVSSTTGDANYILDDGANTSGKIVFDNNENKENEYYTGKQLPIYKSGKTTWYVDEEGIISLQVGDETYGDGKIVKDIKINATVIASEEYIKEKAKVRIEVVYEDELQNIVFNNETITEFEKQNNVYIVEREVTKNGTYEIVANGENGASSKTSVVVSVIDELDKDIQIKSTLTPSSDYVKTTIGIEITFNGELESIKINGESVALPSKTGGKYVVGKDVLENGEYKIEVKGKDGTTNKAVVKVTEITENMEIWNKADMESFRDKVNSGRTFEGRKATLMADIDLNSGKYQVASDNSITFNSNATMWTSIGNSGHIFRGTFEGNNKTIKGLYMRTSSECQGLFGLAENASIKNLSLDSSYIEGAYHLGGIVGYASGIEIEKCCINKNVTIYGSIKNGNWSYVGGVIGSANGQNNNIRKCINHAKVVANGWFVGGICGCFESGNIDECVNRGNVTSYGFYSGGILGIAVSVCNVLNSYNVAPVSGYSSVGGVVGSDHSNGYTQLSLRNSYNIGSVSGSEYTSSIIGMYHQNSSVVNCYSAGNSFSASSLSSVFTSDIKNSNGTWKYNNGYPILKWQIN